MPYRRLPKTDAARLKALQVLLNNNDIYTVRNRFIDWASLNKAQTLYDRLLTATEQYKLNRHAQKRFNARLNKYQHNATLYVSHFLRVLMMSVERGEIKRDKLALYGLPADATAVPNLLTYDNLIQWGRQTIDGEKARIKAGGRPIYNPTIGMVSTHYDIFLQNYQQRQQTEARMNRVVVELADIRSKVDEVILDLWNQIEDHFKDEPPQTRFNHCRSFGVIYYYRRHEPHDY